VDLYVDTNVAEKHTASIFSSEDEGSRLCSSETLVSAYKTTRRYNPEDRHRHLHRRENLKSDKSGKFWTKIQLLEQNNGVM
jgi:hypothetical protein